MPKRASMVGLDDTKAGDQVGLYGKIRNRVKGWKRVTVERVTPTQIIVDGRRFRRVDGKELDYWSSEWMASLTHRTGAGVVADLIASENVEPA